MAPCSRATLTRPGAAPSEQPAQACAERSGSTARCPRRSTSPPRLRAPGRCAGSAGRPFRAPVGSDVAERLLLGRELAPGLLGRRRVLVRGALGRAAVPPEVV